VGSLAHCGVAMIRQADMGDLEQLTKLRALLWPEGSDEEHRAELQSLLSTQRSGAMPATTFVSSDRGGELTGFLDASLRSHADGCDPAQPVAFVEGWFVVEGRRRHGVGRALLCAAEEWARDHGCVEMASDTWIDNLSSQQVHEALDFEVVDRCVHYRKKLRAPSRVSGLGPKRTVVEGPAVRPQFKQSPCG
jgi:aminoglycoside 6'-N-acetyltransferase I